MKEIFERRSVRKYTDERVSEEAIGKLLRAAMRAPSAMNLQPWEFIVVRQRKTLDNLSKVQPYAKMLQQAACAVVICGNTKRGKGGLLGAGLQRSHAESAVGGGTPWPWCGMAWLVPHGNAGAGGAEHT